LRGVAIRAVGAKTEIHALLLAEVDDLRLDAHPPIGGGNIEARNIGRRPYQAQFRGLALFRFQVGIGDDGIGQRADGLSGRAWICAVIAIEAIGDRTIVDTGATSDTGARVAKCSHLLKDKYHQLPDDPATEYLNRIISSSARMTNLVNDLLTFSRLSINQLFRLTDMNMIVDEVLGDLELLIKEKQAEIKVGYLPQLEAIPGQMRQVFQNILTNALKFSKKNERPVITIESQCFEDKSFDSAQVENGNYCMISIADNGIGFDEQYKEKIFTIFQRLHTKEKYEGTGIGLAITKKIIDKHNGIITARSEDGKGSCFQFMLPIRQSSRRK